MASASVCSLLPTQFTISRARRSLITSPTLTSQVFQAPLTLRFENMIRSQIRQKRLVTVLASNSNPQGGDSIKETSDGIAESDTAQGPPFLTILAGIIVFLLVCWVFGSIIAWLFGLIVKVFLSK